ncbi:MAG: ATP phosphoribosyltransferase regulatory subunit [Chloroflexi bacterium]|nr:ATP phosphoribosyltransferase regulatory subunit [Chloroflexota bacterium]
MTSQFEPIRRLPNMQDIGPKELAARDVASITLRGVFGLRGYNRAETPILEHTELYIRKSGGALSSRLYGFSEPGGLEVSLRPEFTSAILRLAADSGQMTEPIRAMYDGPVFRYANPENEDGSKTRQFSQLGAELIGAPAPSADGEVIAMALEGLNAIGLGGARVVIGHVGVVVSALTEFNLSERAKLFLINNIARLKNNQLEEVLEEAVSLGFISDAVVDDAQAEVDRERIASTIKQVMVEGIGVQIGKNTGVRTPEDIIARLARKMSQADNPSDFKRALEMLSKLSRVSGPTAQALSASAKVLSAAGVSESLISNLSEVIKSAEIEGVPKDRMSVDFGIARGIAYYTGMLFDIYVDDDQGETLGGGGRYDGLTRALGYDRDVPSLGFAYNLDSVIEARGEVDDWKDDIVVVSLSDEGSISSAVKKARELRASGKRAAINFQYLKTSSEGQGG